MERRIFLYIIIGFIVVLAVFGIILGYPKVTAAPPQREADTQTSATLWINPLAIVIPGDNPLWFELSDEGPMLISSPEEASLRSFLPWPHSIHVTDMLIQENRLVMAANGFGFLVFIPWDNSRLGMYSVSDKTHWNRYSIASLFLYNQRPSALFYRDDFFAGDEELPLPETQTAALVKGNTQPVKAEIPAFKDFPSIEGWDIEALSRGKNGKWYFAAAQKSSDMQQKFYYQAESLDKQPESISMGDYWLAMEPEALGNAPVLVQETSEAAIRNRSESLSYLIEVISPDSMYEVRYSYIGKESDMISLFVYTDDEKAFTVFPDGSGALGKKNADNSIETFSFMLPELPKDFSYTDIALTGNTIIASWEEQKFFEVGAAGFVLINSPF